MAIARVEQVTDHDHDWVQELTAIKRQFQLLFFIPRRQTVVLSMRQGFWYSLWSPPYLLPKRSLSHKNVESTKQWFRLIKHIRRETALSRGIGFCFSSRHGPSDVSLRHLGWRLDLLEDWQIDLETHHMSWAAKEFDILFNSRSERWANKYNV